MSDFPTYFVVVSVWKSGGTLGLKVRCVRVGVRGGQDKTIRERHTTFDDTIWKDVILCLAPYSVLYEWYQLILTTIQRDRYWCVFC